MDKIDSAIHELFRAVKEKDIKQKIRDFVRMMPPVSQEPDRPGSNVPKQPTVPPMPKGFKAVDVKRGADMRNTT